MTIVKRKFVNVKFTLDKRLLHNSEEEAVEDNRLLCYTGHVATPR